MSLRPPGFKLALKTGWLRKVDDYATMTVNIIIPDYAAVFIESFSRLCNEQEDESSDLY